MCPFRTTIRTPGDCRAGAPHDARANGGHLRGRRPRARSAKTADNALWRGCWNQMARYISASVEHALPPSTRRRSANSCDPPYWRPRTGEQFVSPGGRGDLREAIYYRGHYTRGCDASTLESCKSPSLDLRNSPRPKRPFGLSCVVEHAIEGSSWLVRQVVDLFLGNTVYTPVQQTKLVNALAEMQGVDERAQFVKFAVLTRDPEVAPGTPRIA